MLDGVVLTRDLVVVVALGLTRDGDKVVLDGEPGTSENPAVVQTLTVRLQTRGFAPLPRPRLLAIRDGARPRSTAVLAAWPQTRIQRCVIHNQRNLHDYLRRSDHVESSHLWERLRVALADLRGLVAARKPAALAPFFSVIYNLCNIVTWETPFD